MTEDQKKAYLKTVAKRLKKIQEEISTIQEAGSEMDKVLTTVHYDCQDILTYLSFKIK